MHSKDYYFCLKRRKRFIQASNVGNDFLNAFLRFAFRSQDNYKQAPYNIQSALFWGGSHAAHHAVWTHSVIQK